MAQDVFCIVEAMIGRESDVSLLTPFMDNVPSCVIGDPDRLRGILLNLYTNAAKFTRRGALALHVAVTGPNFQPVPHQHDSLPWTHQSDNNSVSTYLKIWAAALPQPTMLLLLAFIAPLAPLPPCRPFLTYHTPRPPILSLSVPSLCLPSLCSC